MAKLIIAFFIVTLAAVLVQESMACDKFLAALTAAGFQRSTIK